MIRHRQTKSNNELQSEFRRHLRFWLAGELDLTEQMRTPPAPEEQPPARYRPQRSEEAARRGIIHSQKLYRLLAGALCIVFAGLMMMTVANLPPFGAEDSPTVNDVAGRYVGRGTEETGAVNTVAGMILDYRAFDTLGESFVLFTAVCTVTILLHQPAHKTRLRRVQPDRCRYDRDPIVRKMAAFVIPVILVFGVYVLLNGHLSPGGGFSGGAILAAAFILYALVWGRARLAAHDAAPDPDGRRLLAGVLLPCQELFVLYRRQPPALGHLPRYAGADFLGGADPAAERGGGACRLLHDVFVLYVFQKRGAVTCPNC